MTSSEATAIMVAEIRSCRELESALIRVVAFASLTGPCLSRPRP